jgi:prepilin-type N-terminal cleavage/methylation domain-containing protein
MSSQRVVTHAARLLQSRRTRAVRGFSLVELMAVVTIIGILAALGIAVLSKRARESNVTNAIVVVKAIGVAQEIYRAQNQVYLNVSSSNSAWYPRATIRGNQRASFWNAGADTETARWRRLAPDVRQPVQFGFLANAGLPSNSPDTAPSSFLATDFVGRVELPTGIGSDAEPWYLIQARADADNDSVPCGVIAVNWTPQILTFNDGE